MSRSNHHGCSCFMCQYTPARNKRADAAHEADAGEPELTDPVVSLRALEDDEVHVGDMRDEWRARECKSQPTALPNVENVTVMLACTVEDPCQDCQDAVCDDEPWEDHSDCEQCTGYSSLDDETYCARCSQPCTCKAIRENMDFDWKPTEAEPHHDDCPKTNNCTCTEAAE